MGPEAERLGGVVTQLCATRPPDWWDTYDPGARLALALCSVCPSMPACGGGREYGVIRAGVAWNDVGVQVGICSCGYPLPFSAEGVERPECYRCEPPQNLQVPKRLRRRRKRGAVVEHLPQIAAWRAEDVTWEEISRRLGMCKDTVRKAARPQAVSTGDAA